MITIISLAFLLLVGGGVIWSWINIREARREAQKTWDALQIELAVYLGEIEDVVQDKKLLSRVRRNISSPRKASEALLLLRSKEDVSDPHEGLLEAGIEYNEAVLELDLVFKKPPQMLFLCRSCVGFEPF